MLFERAWVLTFTADWERTSLKPYVAMLDQHNLAIMNDRRLINRTKGRPGEPFRVWHATVLTTTIYRYDMVARYQSRHTVVRMCGLTADRCIIDLPWWH
jgi:hypothetical protein